MQRAPVLPPAPAPGRSLAGAGPPRRLLSPLSRGRPCHPRAIPASPLAGRGVVLGLVLALGLGSGCGRRPPAAPPPVVVRYEPAQPLTDAAAPGRASGTQTYLGLIRGETETDLSFRVGGLIERIGDARGDWREGQEVAQGTLLARLQQTEFQSAFDQARAKAGFESARYTNNAMLYRDKAISQQEWDQIRAQHTSAQAELERARQALEDSELRAPFPGTLLARLANSGETVMAGRPVLRIADLSQVAVDLGVPDRVVSRVRPGDPIQLWVRAFEGTRQGMMRTGVVSEVGAAAQPGSRLFKVVVKLDNQDRAIKSGMTASVELRGTAPLPPQAVLVKLSALVAASRPTDPGREPPLAIFVVDADGRARERVVQTDDLWRSSVIVTEGVAVGEKVVVVGAALLHDGARVDARPLAPAGPH